MQKLISTQEFRLKSSLFHVNKCVGLPNSWALPQPHLTDPHVTAVLTRTFGVPAHTPTHVHAQATPQNGTLPLGLLSFDAKSSTLWGSS